MTPLRNNLDQAKAQYRKVRYRGNLADDVLGTSLPIANAPKRGWRDLLALAAALAIGMGAMFLWMSSRSVSTSTLPVVAIADPATRPADTTHIQTQAQTTTQTPTVVVEAKDATPFTAVPTLETFASANTTTGSAGDFSLSVPSHPILFSLASLVEAEAENQLNPSTNGMDPGASETQEPL